VRMRTKGRLTLSLPIGFESSVLRLQQLERTHIFSGSVSFLLALAFSFSLLAPKVWAKTWHIMNDGSGDAPTIQAGVDSADSGDTVLVGPGTYYESIVSLGNGVSLISMEGSEATVIDAARAGSVIQVSGDATIEGFTLKNGLAQNGGGISARVGANYIIIRGNVITMNTAGLQTDSGFGGGVNILDFQNALIENNHISDNYAGDSGGGIAVTGPGFIRNNIIRGNGCHVGGGGVYGGNQTEVTWNLIVENWSDSFGGGVEGSVAKISNNTIIKNFINNSAFSQGAGIQLGTYSPSEIRNNIVAYNHGPTGSGTGVGIKCISLGNLLVGCNDVWSNDVDYELSANCDTTTLRNLSADPEICDPDAENYGLRSTSPCAPSNGNCGLIGAFDVICGPVAIIPTTWGRIKTFYTPATRSRSGL